MKKLYLLLLMSLLLFIPKTFAVTSYQLDQPIPELYGNTLREVFQNRNHAMPDLTGATEISAGVYRIINETNETTDYNVNNGEYIVNKPSGITSVNINLNILEIGKEYTLSYYYISGLADQIRIVQGTNPNQNYLINNADYQYFHTITFTAQYTNLRFVILSFSQYDNLTFKLQLEKGSTATPYQRPTNGPYSNVDVGGFGLSPEQIETYYNLYLDTIRYVGVHDPTYTISTEFFLISTFFMYLLIMGVGYFTKNKYFYFAGALLWFVPLTNFSNIFIIVTSAIVFTLHLIIIFYSDKDDVFE